MTHSKFMDKETKESPHVEKVRRKLKKKMAAESGQMTPEALAKMSSLIERQLMRHAPERIDLKTKEFQLFDKNRHPAAIKSKFVAHLLRDLKSASRRQDLKKMKGRFKR